jgi:hypothetical protein
MATVWRSHTLNLPNELSHLLSRRGLSLLRLRLAIAHLPQQFYLVLQMADLWFVPLSLVRHRCCQDSKFSHFLLQLRKLLFRIRQVLIHLQAGPKAALSDPQPLAGPLQLSRSRLQWLSADLPYMVRPKRHDPSSPAVPVPPAPAAEPAAPQHLSFDSI